MIQLDATGPSYAVLAPHPYLRNQPTYWQKNAFKGIMVMKSEVIGGNIGTFVNDRIPAPPPPVPNNDQVGQTGGSGITQMLPFV